MAKCITLVVAGGELSMRLVDGRMTHNPGIPGDEMATWLPQEVQSCLQVLDWSHQASSHYSVRMTADLVELLNKQILSGSQGVVVVSGTDTVEEMAYLADLMWAYPQPLIFCATHYAPEQVGSDAKAVLYESAQAALSEESWGKGVMVCTQGQLFAASDLVELSNYGRSGFMGIERGPIGDVVDGDVRIWQTPQRCQVYDASTVTPARNVEILSAALGSGERTLAALSEDPDSLDGLVVASFGSGNVYPGWIPYIKALIRADVPVLIVSRCLKGRVMGHSDFEGSFLRLLEMGAMDGDTMSPLKARIKLSVGIGAGLKGQELQDYILS